MKLSAKRQRQIAEAANMLRENLANYSVAFTHPSRSKDFITLRIGAKERENFIVLFLDNQHKLIRDEILFKGTINAASVYPREVVKRALELNAAAVILGHNHPSGNSDPSNADINITRTIKKACDLLDIRVLDHIITGTTVTSLTERGLLHENS